MMKKRDKFQWFIKSYAKENDEYKLLFSIVIVIIIITTAASLSNWTNEKLHNKIILHINNFFFLRALLISSFLNCAHEIKTASTESKAELKEYCTYIIKNYQRNGIKYNNTRVMWMEESRESRARIPKEKNEAIFLMAFKYLPFATSKLKLYRWKDKQEIFFLRLLYFLPWMLQYRIFFHKLSSIACSTIISHVYPINISHFFCSRHV